MAGVQWRGDVSNQAVSGYRHHAEWMSLNEPARKTSTAGAGVAPVTQADAVSKGNKTDAANQVGAVECQTCSTRTYVDGSNDPGVSFKTPGHISPDAAAATVMGHEQEHVSNNQAKASAEGREVVSSSVSIHTSICPECGRVYVSGGTTRTVTQDAKKSDPFTEQYKKVMTAAQGTVINQRA